jgi:FKBP-type peptidyl-prolyl cis-trans isomerase
MSDEFSDVSGDGGVFKSILKEGYGGTPSFGDAIEVHYVGKLENGEIFDSSIKRGKTFKFVIGKEKVIKGWEGGIATMKKGEKAILKCRSDYAYGNRAMGPIPANATLIFEVELIHFGPDIMSYETIGGMIFMTFLALFLIYKNIDKMRAQLGW